MGRRHATTAAHRVAAALHTALLVALAATDGVVSAVELAVSAALVAMGAVDHRLRGPMVPDQRAGVLPFAWLTLTLVGLAFGSGGRSWGLGLVALGLLMRWAGLFRLRARYSDGHRPSGALETGGIYGWTRHPGELGQLLVAWGSAVALGGWALGVAALVVTPVTLRRLVLEDRALGAAFGPDHDAYARRVGWFGPKIADARVTETTAGRLSPETVSTWR